MAIIVPCPACGGKLSAPETAVGKMVRCPRPGCGAVATVPSFVEAAPAPPPPPPPLAKPRPVRAEADDDEDDRPRTRPRRDDRDDRDDDRPRRRRRDDEDDDRPRSRRRRDDDDDYEHDHPRRRRRKRSGMNPGAIVALILGGLVLLGGAGYGIYALVGKKRPALPSGWTEYTSKEDNFRAYFPTEPDVNRTGDRGGPFGGSVAVYTAGGPGDPVRVKVQVIRVPGGIPRESRDKLQDKMNDIPVQMKQAGIEVRSVRWLGVKGIEMTSPKSMGRVVFTDDAVYEVEISGPNGTRARPEEEQAFFDSFELLK